MSSFQLLDGTSIPWLHYGNGTGDAQVRPLPPFPIDLTVDLQSDFENTGKLALQAGFRAIDTAQGYGGEQQVSLRAATGVLTAFQEAQTGELLKSTDIPLDKVYLTSKCMPMPCDCTYIKQRHQGPNRTAGRSAPY
jgi:diketogulonate reductase-like aldo/keto reductase